MAGYRLPDQEGLQLTTPATDPEVLQRPQWPVPAQTGPEYHQPPPELTPGKTQQNTRIGGLRRSTFWVALALTVATVVAAVGAAVGGSLAVKSASHSSCTVANQPSPTQTAIQNATQLPASTPTACPIISGAADALTNLSVPAPSTVVSVALDCPAIDRKFYTSATTGNAYMQLCNHDYRAGGPATGNSGTIGDIVTILAYSMNDCIEACSSMHQFNSTSICAGVAFNANMSNFSTGNCWLKNATGKGEDKTPFSQLLAGCSTRDQFAAGGPDRAVEYGKARGEKQIRHHNKGDGAPLLGHAWISSARNNARIVDDPYQPRCRAMDPGYRTPV